MQPFSAAASMPVLDRPAIVVVSVVYLVAVLAIGIWSARRTRTPRDFFIAGQRIGLFATGLATMSAAFSGFIFVGGPGLTYRMGLASLWIVMPVGVTSGMLCWVVGRRLRRLAGLRQVFTVPDAIAARFDSPAATALAAVSILVGTLAYLGAQLLALGLLLQAVFGFDRLASAMALGLLVLLVYSILGGMVAGVYTDVLQGAVMLVAALAVFAWSLRVVGGWGELTRSIAASDEFGMTFLEPLGRTSVFTAFGFFFVFAVGVLGQPHMLHKFYMLRDERRLKWMPLVLGGSQAVCLLIWLGIGLAVPALVARGTMPPLSRPDDAAPLFLLGYVPDLLAGVTVAGIIAAIMSTSDSFMNLGAGALVRDLPRAFGRPLDDELRAARFAVPLVGLAAALLGLGYGDLIALLGTFAFGTFAAALVPALAIGLNWDRVTAPAAIASIATGLGANLTLEFLAKQRWFPGLPQPPLADGVLPSAVALALSFCVLFAVTLATQPRTLPAEIRTVIDG